MAAIKYTEFSKNPEISNDFKKVIRREKYDNKCLMCDGNIEKSNYGNICNVCKDAMRKN